MKKQHRKKILVWICGCCTTGVDFYKLKEALWRELSIIEWQADVGSFWSSISSSRSRSSDRSPCVFGAAPAEHKRNCSSHNKVCQMRTARVIGLRWQLAFTVHLVEASLQYLVRWCSCEKEMWWSWAFFLSILERENDCELSLRSHQSKRCADRCTYVPCVSAVWIMCLYKWQLNSVLSYKWYCWSLSCVCMIRLAPNWKRLI